LSGGDVNVEEPEMNTWIKWLAKIDKNGIRRFLGTFQRDD